MHGELKYRFSHTGYAVAVYWLTTHSGSSA